jgi:sec-independent protein translocase protein TatB
MFPENRFMEVLIIGALALIVIGPKDLPLLMRRVGRVVGKMRAMAAEFRASFDELARQSELDELRREVESLRKGASLTDAEHTAADPGVSGVFDEIKNNLSLRMTPAMTPLPQPEAVAQPPEPLAPDPAPAPPAPEAKAEPEPPAKPARKPRAKAAGTASQPRKPATRASGRAS